MWYIVLILLSLIIGSIITYCIFKPKLKLFREYDFKVEQENNELYERRDGLQEDIAKSVQQLEILLHDQDAINKSISKLQEQAEISAKFFQEQQIALANVNIEKAIEALGVEYQQYEQECRNEYAQMLNNAAKDYSAKTEELNKINAEIAKVKATLASAREAKQKAELIEAKPQDYTIQLSQSDLLDIKKLFNLASELSNDRVLRMLIWQSYIRTPLNQLCVKVIGEKPVCGIYKLTNTVSGEIYIGQSVDVQERARQHFKQGLGIDMTKNKLYPNMVKYGVWNFAIELLEECPRELLDEKEKTYIDIFGSTNSLNVVKGNG